MTTQPTAADRVAQALEILTEVTHNPESSAALRDHADQARFDLLKAFEAYRAERTPKSANGLRSVLSRVVAVYDRSTRLPEGDPLAGFRPAKTLLS